MDLPIAEKEHNFSDQAERESATITHTDETPTNLSSPTRDYPGRLNDPRSSATSDLPSDPIQPIQAKALEESYEQVIEDPKSVMEAFDWDDLEERFTMKMNECEQTERAILDEFYNWIKVFEAWASTTSVHENERSFKRLKTRMSYVQGAEDHLEEKRQHYVKVVKAFESALALLGPMP